ncbi:GCN5 family acetyltransferase, partial [Pontibacter sp. HJ8]
MNFSQEILLEDERVLLRPFEPGDIEQLQTIAPDEEIWRYMISRISNRQELEAWTQAARRDREVGQRYTFVIVDKATGQIAGSTAYGNVSEKDKRLEIGWTWLARDFRGSGLNRHCKFL